MEYETPVGLSVDPALGGGLLHPVRHSWSENSVESEHHNYDSHQPRRQEPPVYSSRDRVCAQTPPKHTRTCNKLPDVYMCTSQVALMDMDRGIGIIIVVVALGALFD